MTEQRKLKIVFVIRWHSDHMGYANNCLSKSLAELGHEVHIVTSKYQSYYNHPNYKEIYESFLGPNILPLGESYEGKVKVHRISSVKIRNTIVLSSLYRKLREIKPDIVQTFDANEIHSVKSSLYTKILGFKFFTGNHTILISFRLLQNWKKLTFKRRLILLLFFRFPAKIIRLSSRMCYAVTNDARLIAIRLFGLPKDKVKVETLGVDTHIFYSKNNLPATEQTSLRKELGFNDEDIVCIFTGKITEEKSPEILAKAIEVLNRSGESFKALYVGSGNLKSVIQNYKNVKVVDFVQFHELGNYYRVADIAVWPRSVTTSILDAAACGLPVIISDEVYAYDLISSERLDSDSKPKIIARKYKTGDVDDLCRQLLSLKDNSYRKTIGEQARQLIVRDHSWDAIAKRRLEDYYHL